jgi:hypothetical protein
MHGPERRPNYNYHGNKSGKVLWISSLEMRVPIDNMGAGVKDVLDQRNWTYCSQLISLELRWSQSASFTRTRYASDSINSLPSS